MRYKKVVNFLENTPNQPCKFGTNIWVKKIMVQMERITPVLKLNLDLQCKI